MSQQIIKAYVVKQLVFFALFSIKNNKKMKQFTHFIFAEQKLSLVRFIPTY